VDELIRRFVESNPTLFDARGRAAGQGYDHMGPDKADALAVDADDFARYLIAILVAPEADCSRRGFFIAVHQAYDKAVHSHGRNGKVIVYQAHNPLDVLGNDGLLRDFPEAKLLLTMQESVRSLVSLIYQKNSENIYKIAANGRYLLCFKATIEGWRGLLARVKKSRRMITCMNALNRNLKAETMRYCAFIGIEWQPQMMLSTFNDMVWNGDNWSRLPVVPGTSNADVLEARKRAVLYRRDELILKVLSSDVRRACCFYDISFRDYAVGLLAFHLPMKVEAIGIANAWGRRALGDIRGALYFYLRRLMMSYGLFARAILCPSEN
jgi:hypothetical protein